MKTIIALMLVTFSFSSYAQYDDSFMFDEIGIEGEYAEQGENPAERMKKMRAKLEKRNELMVRKRIEGQRVQQEKEMMRKLQKTMNQTFNQLEENLNNM